MVSRVDLWRCCVAVASHRSHGYGRRVEIEREWASSGGRCDLKYLKRRKTTYEDLNGLDWDWFSTARSKELPVSGRMLQVCFI